MVQLSHSANFAEVPQRNASLMHKLFELLGRQRVLVNIIQIVNEIGDELRLHFLGRSYNFLLLSILLIEELLVYEIFVQSMHIRIQWYFLELRLMVNCPILRKPPRFSLGRWSLFQFQLIHRHFERICSG